MDLYKIKRIAPFFYYIPAIVVVFFEILIPGWLFLLLIVPYLILSIYTIKKLPKEEVTNIDYVRMAFLGMAHITLYILMYWK